MCNKMLDSNEYNRSTIINASHHLGVKWNLYLSANKHWAKLLAALTWKHSDVTLPTLVKKIRLRVIDVLGEAEIYTRYY